MVRRRLTLDAGALIAYDRGERGVCETIQRALDGGTDVRVPAGALAQVWRDRRRQTRLARLLRQDDVTVSDLDEVAAKASGELCGRTATSDVIDASVVVCALAQGGRTVLTSDPADISRLDPRLDVRRV